MWFHRFEITVVIQRRPDSNSWSDQQGSSDQGYFNKFFMSTSQTGYSPSGSPINSIPQSHFDQKVFISRIIPHIIENRINFEVRHVHIVFSKGFFKPV